MQHIEKLEAERDALIAKPRKVSGYTFILFSSVTEIVRFKKLMK